MALSPCHKRKSAIAQVATSLCSILTIVLFLFISASSAIPLHNTATPSSSKENNTLAPRRNQGSDTSAKAIAEALSLRRRAPLVRHSGNKFEFQFDGEEMMFRSSSSPPAFKLGDYQFTQTILYRIEKYFNLKYNKGSVLHRDNFPQKPAEMWSFLQSKQTDQDSAYIYPGFFLLDEDRPRSENPKQYHAVMPMPDTTLYTWLEVDPSQREKKTGVSIKQMIVHMQDLFRGIQLMLQNDMGTWDIAFEWAFVTFVNKKDKSKGITMQWARFDNLRERSNPRDLWRYWNVLKSQDWVSPEEQETGGLDKTWKFEKTMVFRVAWIALTVLTSADSSRGLLPKLREALQKSLYDEEFEPTCREVLEEYLGGKLATLSSETQDFFAHTLCKANDRWEIEELVEKWPQLSEVRRAAGTSRNDEAPPVYEAPPRYGSDPPPYEPPVC